MTNAPYRALRPLERSRLHEELVERLAELVREAEMKRGDRFPAERELALKLGVSRSSIRQAMVALDATGFVEVRHGGGVFLRRPMNFGESFGALFDRRRELPEAVEARELLEVKLAELAAVRRSAEDIRALQTILKGMESEVAAGRTGATYDSDFHRRVAHAARSPILQRMLEEMSATIDDMRTEYLSEPGRPEKALSTNRAVLAQIHLGIPQMASRAMREHVQAVAEALLAPWPAETR